MEFRNPDIYIDAVQHQKSLRTEVFGMQLKEYEARFYSETQKSEKGGTYLPRKPITVLMEFEKDELKRMSMYPMGLSRSCPQAWTVTEPLRFTVKNRVILFEVSVKGSPLSDAVVAEVIRTVGKNSVVFGLTLYDTALTPTVMKIVDHFAIEGVIVHVPSNAIAPGIKSLGTITTLVVNGEHTVERLECIKTAPNLSNLIVQLKNDEASRKLFTGLIAEWQQGKRNITRWIIHCPNEWGIIDQDYNRDDDNGESILLLRATMGCEGLSDDYYRCHTKMEVPVSPEGFKILSVIGSGSFGKVFKVVKTSDPGRGRVFAMKAIQKSSLETRTDQEHMQREQKILESIDNIYCCKLFQSCQSVLHLFLIMELCSGKDLWSFFEKHPVFTEHETRFVLAELTIAIEYIHHMGVVHRDIKSENIFMDNKGHMKLGDFGLAQDGIFEEKTMIKFCGTIQYMAPEILRRELYGKEVDWWSFGVVAYEIAEGIFPFNGETWQETKQLIMNETAKPKNKFQFLPELLLDLLTKEPKDRLGAVQVKAHKFFRTVNWAQVASGMLESPFKLDLSGEEDFYQLAEITDQQEDANKTNPPEIEEDDDYFDCFSFDGMNDPISRNKSVSLKVSFLC
ncbi:unnamed protein product [Caenorhabditis sp. 36 PRJEB53466]|nr:unnamed protein product [Caenorhabditis sp. 36 PRJEB53466]